MRQLNHYKLSETNHCLLDLELTRLVKKEPVIKRRYVSSWGESTRLYSLIDTNVGHVLADRKTGTLFYPETGRCLTSERVHLVAHTKEKPHEIHSETSPT